MHGQTTPTIKGIFVLSHINVLRKIKGDAGFRVLEERYGHAIHFKNSDDVPVREEVKIIGLTLDILSATPIPSEIREFEAGKLHFRNFSETPLGKLILPVFRSQFKRMLLNAGNLAGHVFRGVTFTSQDVGKQTVVIAMDNNDYPIDHFRGFFQQWMEYSGLSGSVEAVDEGKNRYVYTIHW